jgi:hypothetical protein
MNSSKTKCPCKDKELQISMYNEVCLSLRLNDLIQAIEYKQHLMEPIYY